MVARKQRERQTEMDQGKIPFKESLLVIRLSPWGPYLQHCHRLPNLTTSEDKPFRKGEPTRIQSLLCILSVLVLGTSFTHTPFVGSAYIQTIDFRLV